MSPSGKLVAEILTTAWRPVPAPLSVSTDQVPSIEPLLLATGAAALACRRLRLADISIAGQSSLLKEAYRKHSIEAAVHEINTRDIFKRARAANIEPVLFKGWALARLYPEDGLRPYGDIDLWVRPKDLDQLQAVLPRDKDRSYCVEPRASFYPQFERSIDDVLRRSQVVRVNDVLVRIPSDEDHLRFICLHFLYHGGWRPLWLCDIGMMVESAGSRFDWDSCLRGTRKHADWVACAIGLAHQLLGAEVKGTPVERRAVSLPRWLSNAILRQWSKGSGMSHAEDLSFSLPRRLRQPKQLLHALQAHWRNPIQASVEMDAWFGESPRSILQVGSAISRLPQFAQHLGKEIRRG